MLRFVKGWKTTLWGGCGAIALALITPTLAGEIPPRTSQSAASASFQPGSVEGQLASDGDTLNDGRHYQVHVLEGQAEQQVTIKLTSHEFAPYLVVLDPEGHKIAEAGDGGATNQARIVTTLLKEGTYTLVASSQAAAATGRYTLSWQAASSEEAPLAEAGKLSQQIAELSAQGNYPEAIALAEQLLTLRKTIQSGDRPEIATSLNTLAFLYQSQGRSGEAEPLYTEALAMRRRLYEGDHADVALSLNNLASLYQSQSQYSQAQPLLTEALAMRQRLFEGDHPDIALSLNNLAALY
ncbi:MAG: tetratricopeptide repeat protein, partial [Cyanophyceae cyanobacterium]